MGLIALCHKDRPMSQVQQLVSKIFTHAVLYFIANKQLSSIKSCLRFCTYLYRFLVFSVSDIDLLCDYRGLTVKNEPGESSFLYQIFELRKIPKTFSYRFYSRLGVFSESICSYTLLKLFLLSIYKSAPTIFCSYEILIITSRCSF